MEPSPTTPTPAPDGFPSVVPPPKTGTPSDFRNARRKSAELHVMGIDQLPPHDEAAEQGVLGCILLDPACLSECPENPDVFYDLRHRQIFEGCVAVSKQSKLDAITLRDWLQSRNLLEGVGGISYVASLPDAVPSAENLPYYVEIIREKYVLRRMIATCTEAVASAYKNKSGESGKIIQHFKSAVEEVDQLISEKDIRPVSLVLKECVDRYEKLVQGKSNGIPTGFPPIDIIGGFMPGEMVLVMGETGMGKSTLALNMLASAIKSDHPAAVFSLEMSDGAWMDRFISLDLSVDRRAFRSKAYFTDGVLLKIASNMAKLGKMPLWISDDPSSAVYDIDRIVRKMVETHKLKLVVVDYAQLVAPGNQDSREQQVAAIGRGLRSLAQSTGTVIYVLSQLNDDGKVRESRALLHDAHVGIRIEERDEELRVVCVKGRDMNFEDFPVDFDRLHCRITHKIGGLKF